MTKIPTTYIGSILATLFIAVFLTSCGTSKKVKWSTDHLGIKSAYVQKYIPGQEDEEIISYLFIDIELLDSSIVLDKALYNDHIEAISTVRFPLKINWLNGETSTTEKLESNQAIIYYYKGKKQFKQLVENIETKEDLYLP